ncbi:MAG: Crp/Fnr family transcriptional regulator [Alphaproteobacteria bacterium]|jgi:CRP/FNR family transcriptional regulator, cyclic AMP receptor protein|nr:Crp/Fnr family transcriptional regulator [Alphaproteobacteria bacterium]
MPEAQIQNRKVSVPKNGPGNRPLDVVNYPAGGTIFAEGSPGFRAFIVQTGLVEISRVGTNGQRVLGYVGHGEVFGEMAPVDNEPRMASAKAVKDTTCVVIPEELLKAKIEGADPFIRDLMYVLIRGLRQVTKTLTDTSDD